MTFRVRIYGNPVAQGRPRATIIAGHAHVYDPEKSRDWKRTVQGQVLSEWRARGYKAPLEGALKLDLCFWLARPKSLSKKVRYHTRRPDVDNLVKAVKDACRGVLYQDDSQVVLLVARKVYGPQPGVDLLLEELERVD